MYLYDVVYFIKSPKGGQKMNTISSRGRSKVEALFRFRIKHPTEKVIKAKQVGVLSIYTADVYDYIFKEFTINIK